jgi:hypothetical protein
MPLSSGSKQPNKNLAVDMAEHSVRPGRTFQFTATAKYSSSLKIKIKTKSHVIYILRITNARDHIRRREGAKRLPLKSSNAQA